MSLLTRCAVVCALWMFGSAALSAQTTGTLVGRVTDPSGAVVPGATVEAENVGTGLVRTGVTDTLGTYLMPGLPLGGYKLTVDLPGFKKIIRTGINLQLGENARVDLELELGATEESVTVQGDALRVDTVSSTIGTSMTQRQVQDLPLNGRNPVALAQMLPGVGLVSIQTAPTFQRGSGPALNISGARNSANSFMLDGVVLTPAMTNVGLNLPNPDTLEEFRILTHNYGAEYGRAEGAILLAATKSGTNQLHGKLWEFLRNDTLNARNFFASSKPFLRQNQFGGNSGGPVVRNRTFFFVSYEGLEIRQQSLITGFPTTAAERQGDFAASPRAIIDPTTGQPFPGNIIPADRIDPLARSMLAYVPFPDRPDGSLQHLRSIPVSGKQIVAKGEHQFTPRDRVSYRYYRNLYVNSANGGGISDQLIGVAKDTTESHSVTYNRVFNPSLFNELRASYTRWVGDNQGSPAGKNPQDIGALYSANPGGDPRQPGVTVTGRMSISPPTQLIEPDRFLQLDDKLLWSRGGHHVTAGFRFMRNRHGDVCYCTTSGQFTFNGAFTGNVMADYMLGRPNAFLQYSTIIDDPVSYEFHPFLSDDFKISPKLTLNLGVRYQLDIPWVQLGGRNSTFRLGQQSTVFPSAPQGLVFAGDAGIPKGMYPTDKNNFAPRIGLAWDPAGNGRTAVRTAYGVFFSNIAQNTSAFSTNNAPFILPYSIVPFSFSDPYRGRENPFPYEFSANPRFIYPIEVLVAAPEVQTGYIHQYNVSIQQQLGQDIVAMVAYVGSVSRNGLQQHDMNTAVYGPGATAGNVQVRRPILPQYYAGIGVITSDSSSKYDSLQVEVQKRFSKGYTFQIAYTLSKNTTNASGGIGGSGAMTLQDPNNRFAAQNGPAAYDQRHVFGLNGSWELPFPRNKRALSQALEGWSMAGTLRVSSGLPVNVLSGCDCALIGSGRMVGPQRPNLVGNPNLDPGRAHQELVSEYFSKAAFALPAAGQFGNVGPNSLVGPGFSQTDLVISRRFPFGQSRLRALQFRVEIFNLFNQVNFMNPTDPLTSPGFGRLVAARDPRIVQLALKYDF
jgi:Carboxypeptidase regulatory-like domain/TonB-dependent Receptor Plug Domain